MTKSTTIATLIFAILVIGGCAGSGPPTDRTMVPTVAPETNPRETPTPAPTPTAAPTDTSEPPPTPTPEPTPTAAPTDTPEPPPTPTPEPTPTAAPTDTPEPPPTPTPDLQVMVVDCELAFAVLRSSNLLEWSGSDNDGMVVPEYVIPGQCSEFREHSPDEYLGRFGHVISGSFSLLDDDLGTAPSSSPLKHGCWGTGGYDDIRIGLPVVIRDGNGTIIAKDELWNGKTAGWNKCVFPFYVFNVTDADFYEISVGNRGSVVYSRDDLQQNDWHVTLSLGSP